MIFEDPPERVLQTADKIVLFDTHLRGRQEVLFSNWKADIASPGSQVALVVSIPIDFRDIATIYRWKGRIAQVRANCDSGDVRQPSY
jgi:hypothetical protein